MARIYRNFNPAELGIDAVSAVTTTSTTGLAIRVRDLDRVVFVFEFSSTPITGHFRCVPVDKEGVDLPAIQLNGAAFVFGDGTMFSMGPGVGVRSGGVVIAPVLCGSIVGLDRIKAEVEVTGAGAGTYSLHLFGQGAGLG